VLDKRLERLLERLDREGWVRAPNCSSTLKAAHGVQSGILERSAQTATSGLSRC